MSKKSEVRNRIKIVMADLGMKKNQAAFAKALGFKPTTLNAWMTGASLASPDAYMTLARRARNIEDSLFFWEQAGLTRETIRSAAAKIIDEQRALVGDQIIGTPRIRETAEGMKQDGTVGVSAPYISNPHSTNWLVVSEGLACGPFKVNDIIKVENDDGDASEERFYDGPIVIAEFPDEEPEHRLFPLKGRAIGTFMRRPGFTSSIPMLEFAPLKGEFNTSAVIGMSFPSDMRSGPDGQRLASAIAREDAELRRVQIIGRVTGWLATTPHPEK